MDTFIDWIREVGIWIVVLVIGLSMMFAGPKSETVPDEALGVMCHIGDSIEKFDNVQDVNYLSRRTEIVDKDGNLLTFSKSTPCFSYPMYRITL